MKLSLRMLGPLTLALSMSMTAWAADAPTTAGWPVTEGSPGGGRYSPLKDIHIGNVHELKEVWRYRHGDYFDGSFPMNRGTSFITTPIVVDEKLVFTTPTNRVIALDPEDGTELWTFDPGLDESSVYANMWANRGLAVWHGESDDSCSPRIFLTTLDAQLIALHASTGKPCVDFPTVDLRASIAPIIDRPEYGMTSPGTVVGDVIVVGSSIPDMVRANSPPGDVRGFDARTGELLWTFHTIPREGEFGRDSWLSDPSKSGAANVWSTMTADVERGLVFLPVSSASPDHYGGDRKGANLFSDAVVALNAKTGERRWHFQTTHHDVWDYDLAAPPLLLDVQRDGETMPAVVVLAKTGFVFVLHRETGQPLFPVHEVAVPKSDVPGEEAAPTQPMPVKPPPLVSQRFSQADLYAPTPEHREACARRLAGLRNDGLYTPPSLQGSLVHPATGGGANWPGSAYDPIRRLVFVPVANLGMEIRLEHVSDTGVGEDGGARPMRGLSLRNLWWYLTGRGSGHRYRVADGHILFAHDGTPCNKPPWGRLVAVDVNEGKIVWSVSTTSNPEDLGNSSLQPPLATAGGLVFHGGTWWPTLRIHNSDTGERIGTIDLPAGVHGGTITYKLRPNGRQFLVVSAGGHDQLGSPKGDYVIAFALPE